MFSRILSGTQPVSAQGENFSGVIRRQRASDPARRHGSETMPSMAVYHGFMIQPERGPRFVNYNVASSGRKRSRARSSLTIEITCREHIPGSSERSRALLM